MLRALTAKRVLAMFSSPVPREEPFYHEVVTRPMDLGTVSAHLSRGKYKTLGGWGSKPPSASPLLFSFAVSRKPSRSLSHPSSPLLIDLLCLSEPYERTGGTSCTVQGDDTVTVDTVNSEVTQHRHCVCSTCHKRWPPTGLETAQRVPAVEHSLHVPPPFPAT